MEIHLEDQAIFLPRYCHILMTFQEEVQIFGTARE